MRPMLRDGLIDFAIVLAVGTAPGICCPRSTKPIARFTHQARRHHWERGQRSADRRDERAATGSSRPARRAITAQTPPRRY
jgi:hypothetical protein